MAGELEGLLRFLEEQKAKHAAHFPALKRETVLSFMATNSLAGTHAAVAVCPIGAIAPVDGSRALDVRVRGPLPRTPRRGECITVHITNVEQYQGFQIKTHPLAADGDLPSVVEARGDDLTVKGNHIFTVHHSPYTMKFFEQIPFDEVQETVGGVRYALVAVGENANISPRFIWQFEERQGRVVLFHGDGLALKTYMNLKSNRQATRVVVDLDEYRGYTLRGTVEEFAPHQHPEAYDRICRGFTAGSWGKPSRVFRFLVDDVAPLAPVG